MMPFPTLRNLLETLQEIAPEDLAEPWDNPGLQVGFVHQRVEKIALALDHTPESVRFALRHSAQVLLTHHPLIFKPMSSITDSEYPGAVICTAIREGLSVVSIHTNLDAAHGGINTILANLLGLRDVVVLSLRPKVGGQTSTLVSGFKGSRESQNNNDGSTTGLGRIGNLTEPCTLSQFVLRTKGILGLDVVKVVGSADRTIRRVAVVGGSGGSLIREAWSAGADLLVTGDVSYHQAREAELLGLAVIDGGHFATERAAFKQFAGRLESEVVARGWDVAILFNDEEKQPLVFM